MKHPLVCGDTDLTVDRLVTISHDPYTATADSRAMFICMEWDEFKVRVYNFCMRLQKLQLRDNLLHIDGLFVARNELIMHVILVRSRLDFCLFWINEIFQVQN